MGEGYPRVQPSQRSDRRAHAPSLGVLHGDLPEGYLRFVDRSCQYSEDFVITGPQVVLDVEVGEDRHGRSTG